MSYTGLCCCLPCREFSDLFPSFPLPGTTRFERRSSIHLQKWSARRVYACTSGPRTTRPDPIGVPRLVDRRLSSGGGGERGLRRFVPRSLITGVMRCVGSSSSPSLLSSWPPTHAITVAAPASTFEKSAISVLVVRTFLNRTNGSAAVSIFFGARRFFSKFFDRAPANNVRIGRASSGHGVGKFFFRIRRAKTRTLRVT